MIRKLNLRQLFSTGRDHNGQKEAIEEAASTTSVVESGDFRIDLVERTATLRGQELHLTSEEFDVLVFLVGHPQRLVTPQTMLATRWSAARLRQTEFLRVLMSLRSKLEAVGPDQHYLRTERWVLYRFDPVSSPA